MSNEKLTCKLSDGREYEVVRVGGGALGDNIYDYTSILVKPIKREPREWWVAQSEVGRFVKVFASLESAKDFACEYFRQPYEIIHVREVL